MGTVSSLADHRKPSQALVEAMSQHCTGGDARPYFTGYRNQLRSVPQKFVAEDFRILTGIGLCLYPVAEPEALEHQHRNQVAALQTQMFLFQVHEDKRLIKGVERAMTPQQLTYFIHLLSYRTVGHEALQLAFSVLENVARHMPDQMNNGEVLEALRETPLQYDVRVNDRLQMVINTAYPMNP